MQLKQRFRLLLGIKFALATGLAILAAALFQNQHTLSRAQQIHFQSYRLADELRQSSDDLTRLARAFVATGDEEYERQYGAVLDIRDGKAPRPDGPAISLHDLMIREGFTPAELALLTSARQYSDALVQSERIAMNAARGLFDDGTGNFTVRGTPDRDRATTLLHDGAYRDNKARIMQPINDFYAMFMRRTAGDVARFEQRSLALLALLGADIVVILGLFVYSFASLWRQMRDREHAEAALRENEARIRVLGDNLPSGMIYQLNTGPDGKERRFTYLSAGVEKLHEVTAATVLEDAGVLDRQIVPGDRAAVAAREAAALAAMKPFRAEMRSQLPSGRIRWNLVTSAPRLAANGHVFWDGIELDITESKEVESALRASEERYRQLNAELEQRVTLRTAELAARNREIEALLETRQRTEREALANLERERQLSEMKSQFITVASHEFRTPLAAAVGSVEMLERHAGRLPEAKRRELLTRIQRALERLTAIMDDMLKLSRADSGRVKVTRMDVDLGRFVLDVLQKVEAGDRQQHRLRFQQTGGPAVVPADTHLLHHILSNLLENAVRYSPAGTTVTVTLDIHEKAFALTIADEGPGVPAAERERIFEPFVRGSNIGAIGGTGLGLNLARRYAGLMGGAIELLPAARGAIFRVSVPLHQPTA